MSVERMCEHYQAQLSALLDGELEPRAMRALLDHLLDCPDCACFYAEARDLQTLVDRLEPLALEPATEPAPEPVPARRRSAWLRPSPAWGWAAAMVIAVVAGVWGAEHVRNRPGGGEIPSGAGETPVVIDVANQAAPMDEARFVELTVELLQADERYQREMSAVLKQVARLRTEDDGDGL